MSCLCGRFITPLEPITLKIKSSLAERITGLYASIPLPKFYVVVIFEEISPDSCFVGGEPNNNFIRFKVDHIARTLPGAAIREWWVRTIDEIIAPPCKGQRLRLGGFH